MNNEREMILTEEEITVKTNVSDSSFTWDGITKVSASKTSYFLFIAANQALMAPKDAFATEADHDAFLELLMEKGLWP